MQEPSYVLQQVMGWKGELVMLLSTKDVQVLLTRIGGRAAKLLPALVQACPGEATWMPACGEPGAGAGASELRDGSQGWVCWSALAAAAAGASAELLMFSCGDQARVRLLWNLLASLGEG